MGRRETPGLPPVPFAVSGVVDSHPHRRIARLVRDVGVRRARLDLLPMFVLGVLGGIYVAIGGMLYTLLMSEPASVGAVAHVIAGVGLSVGFLLVIVAGGELFTANLLTVMAWADGLIYGNELRRNWAILFAANLAGALLAAMMATTAGIFHIGGREAMASTAVALAEAKSSIPFAEAVLRGFFGGILVCLAVWLCFATQSMTDRILAILIPVSAFVALGFEHVVACMYLIPAGMILGSEAIAFSNLVFSLIAVALGNMIGGGVCVAVIYWAVYLRRPDDGATPNDGT